MGPVDESRRADDEAAAIAAERIRSGAAEDTEDGAEALASLGIALLEEGRLMQPVGYWLPQRLTCTMSTLY
jgi:hypothetical protein